MQVDAVAKLESEDDADDKGLVLDDTSEFVRGIALQPAIERKPVIKPAASTSVKVEDVPLEELDTEMAPVVEAAALDAANEMDVDDAAAEARLLAGDDVKPPAEADAITDGTAGELLVSTGIGATLSLLRQQGLMKPMTPEERAKDEEYKAQKKWIADRRNDQLRREADLRASKAAGSSKDQYQREMDNKRRIAELARVEEERMKSYKPNIDIKYLDEHGRNMTPKEAWKCVYEALGSLIVIEVS